MSDYESEESYSDISDYSNPDGLEHSYGDDVDSEPQQHEEEEEDDEFEVREIDESRDREDHFRRMQREEERLVPVPKDLRQCLDVLSKYEKARVLGTRAQQIAKNAPLYVPIPEEELVTLNALQIAEEELRQGAIPFVIRRYLPDGSY